MSILGHFEYWYGYITLFMLYPLVQLTWFQNIKGSKTSTSCTQNDEIYDTGLYKLDDAYGSLFIVV